MRPPVLCAGCPHRGSFFAIKKALGRTPAVLCGDIGCYTLGNAKPLEAIDTCLCMGAGITMAQGFAVAEPGTKCVAFVGDSTFFSSGLTGVANAVYNGHDITIAVLDNSITAMTGGQPHPGTGVTLMGAQSQPIDIEGVLRALGISCIERADAFDTDSATAAAQRALDHEGPSAIIFTGPCIQMVKPDAPVTVDVQKCTGCSVCIKRLGCPAMSLSASLPRSGQLDAAASPGTRSGADSAGSPREGGFALESDANSGTGEALADFGGPAGREQQSVTTGTEGVVTKAGLAGSGGVHSEKQIVFIDPSLCTGCNLCVPTCPFDAIEAGE